MCGGVSAGHDDVTGCSGVPDGTVHVRPDAGENRRVCAAVGICHSGLHGAERT